MEAEGPRALRAGEVLVGKYQLVRLIGRGGFGLVYEALHLGLRSRVALKLLNPEARQDPKTVARFRQEAWTAARIDSPHVVRVTDIDVLPDGTPFLVMELLEGRDLERELRERRRLPHREAVDHVLQAARGVREAHARGVVHRDLKTSNLFLANEPSGTKVKVLDFGLSKIAAELGMTATFSALGTPSYASPEQLSSAKDADVRSDIWSLGVILYQLLTGKLPFVGRGAPDLILAIVSKEPPDLAELAPDVPAGLCRAVHKALSKQPAARFQSIDELAGAIARFGSAPTDAYVPPRQRAVPVVSAAVEPGPSSTFLDSAKDTPPEQRSSRLWTGVALLVAAVFVTVAVGLELGAFGPNERASVPTTTELPARAPAAPVIAPQGPEPVTATPSTIAPSGATANGATATAAVTPSASASTTTADPPAKTPTPRRAPRRFSTAKAKDSTNLGF